MPAARTYAVPAEWRDCHGIRRYGFHGLSYAWALRRASELLGRLAADVHVVLAHLGGGASICAVRRGQSVWTSMGFTPLEGLAMVTRSGSVDPGRAVQSSVLDLEDEIQVNTRAIVDRSDASG